MHQLTTAPDSEISPAAWTTMKEQAQVLVQSGMLPETVKTWQSATAIMMKGKELGIAPMQAFSHIHIIKGKPTISAELMMFLIYRAFPTAKIEFLKVDADGCHVSTTRPAGKPVLFKFEPADAKAAGLLGKDMWAKYPRAMYRSRCVSEMARTVYPDALMGASYTPEELGATVNEEGEVIDVAVESAKSEHVEAEPKVEIYTATALQQTRMLSMLKARKIDESLWEDVSKAMMGKVMMLQNLEDSIEAVVKRHA